jgi:hypothetical protein
MQFHLVFSRDSSGIAIVVLDRVRKPAAAALGARYAWSAMLARRKLRNIQEEE